MRLSTSLSPHTKLDDATVVNFSSHVSIIALDQILDSVPNGIKAVVVSIDRCIKDLACPVSHPTVKARFLNHPRAVWSYPDVEAAQPVDPALD